MPKAAPHAHVCFGSPEDHLDELARAAAGGDAVGHWTINLSAEPGDRVVFYLMAPLSSFVATGLVTSETRTLDEPSSPWHGHTVADVAAVRMLPAAVPLADARAKFPDWGFLGRPRRSGMVPLHLAAAFLRFLRAGAA